MLFGQSLITVTSNSSGTSIAEIRPPNMSLATTAFMKRKIILEIENGIALWYGANVCGYLKNNVSHYLRNSWTWAILFLSGLCLGNPLEDVFLDGTLLQRAYSHGWQYLPFPHGL